MQCLYSTDLRPPDRCRALQLTRNLGPAGALKTGNTSFPKRYYLFVIKIPRNQHAFQPYPAMITLPNFQRKIVEELSELYEAFFAAQECLEESDYLTSARRITKPLAADAAFGNCGPRVSS